VKEANYRLTGSFLRGHALGVTLPLPLRQPYLQNACGKETKLKAPVKEINMKIEMYNNI